MNYKDIIYSLQDSFEKHPYPAVVLYSRVAIEYGNTSYPAILIQINNLQSNKGMNNMNVTIVGIDMYTDTETIIEKQSTMIDCIKQSLNRFNDTVDKAYIKNATYIPYFDQFSDRTCGTSVTVDIEFVDDIGECYIKDCEEDC